MSRRVPIGLSSGSFHGWDADTAATETERLGGSVVDLRVGKGQAWEPGGLEPFRRGGLDIAFLGLSCVLGADSPETVMERHATDLAEGLPVKIFCHLDARSAASLARAVETLDLLAEHAGGRHRIHLETHAGYAEVDDLLWWAEEHGVRLLLDSMGLAGISADPLADVRRIAAHVDLAQVKGFVLSGAGARHRPLAEQEEWHRSLLTGTGSLAAVTVESKAGVLADDLACLDRILNDGDDA